MIKIYGAKKKNCKSIELKELSICVFSENINYLADFLMYIRAQINCIINDPEKAFDANEGEISQSHWHLRDWDKNWDKKEICDIIISIQLKAVKNAKGELVWSEKINQP